MRTKNFADVLKNMLANDPELASEVAAARIRADIEGEVWSRIRSELPNLRESLKECVNADAYEKESAYFDGIAAALAEAVCAEPDNEESRESELGSQKDRQG